MHGFIRLEQLCRFLKEKNIPVRRMADAIDAVTHTARYVSPSANQAPNPRFTWDLDGNGVPDGWAHVTYAPSGMILSRVCSEFGTKKAA
jgi:hypothetical protein